jgi:hypothetical protein
MATVTITEILGGDNIAASRIVINNNFTLLQNAINTLETRLNTSYVPGGSLNVGDAQILKYNRSISQTIFLLQASGQIDGNLGLGTPTFNAQLSVTGDISVSNFLGIEESVGFNNNSGTSTFNNYLSTEINDSLSDLQWYTAGTKNPVVLTQSLSGPAYQLPITGNTKVLHLDITAYTGVGPTNIDTFSLPPVSSVRNGQIITLVFDTQSGAPGTFELDNSTNFATPFSNATLGYNIKLNNTIVSDIAGDDRFLGIWIDLMAGSTGWKVIGAHPDVLYI